MPVTCDHHRLPGPRADAIDRAERILRTRIDEFGVEEPNIQKAGADRLIVELPGIGPDDESRAKDIIQQSAFLEFKLVLPVMELQSQLAQIDRQIVSVLGADSIRALGGATEDTNSEVEDLLFGGLDAPDSAQADSTGVDGEDVEEDQSVNLRPFTGLLAGGDFEGVYLVATENVETAMLYLAMPEVQRSLRGKIWQSALLSSV